MSLVESWNRDSVSPLATVSEGCKIWGSAQVREGATLGANCVVGRGAYIGVGVTLGANCKIQNNALVYEPAELGEGVFIGPGVVLTNDRFPRAVTPKGRLKSPTDWDLRGVVVAAGASVGANAVCIGPIKIGEWAMVAAGAVVTKDVLAFSLVAGVPAEHRNWVGRAGKPLDKKDGHFLCPETGEIYIESQGLLSLVV